MDDVQRDLNLMMVYATEGYAKRHGISESEAFNLFKKYNINNYFRKYYGVLHTQDFDEDVFFAEDLIERAKESALQGTNK
ncbi:MAG: DUF3791 domain-containing protein [Fibromonadales bacterium]|nr:DUF3791 domain-containing protein [Fibromonadales bacterium]